MRINLFGEDRRLPLFLWENHFVKKFHIASVIAFFILVCALIFFLTQHKNGKLDTAIPEKKLQASHIGKPAPKTSLMGTNSKAVKLNEIRSKTVKSAKQKQLAQNNTGAERNKELEYEYELNKEFEAEAIDTFPLHTINTFNPLKPEPYGPKKGELWIRIKVEHSREFKEIMAQVADLYKDVANYNNPVTVLLWVGNRPWAKFTYPSPESDAYYENGNP